MIDALGLPGFFLLHRDMLELAREVARRGARAGHGPRAAAAGARARLVGVLDRLLPHRPLARRPDRERAVPRALPQRGAHRAAGHRPRLPARRPRGADPARARALRRASARRSSPPSRPSARAARSASWARCSGLPPGEIERVARGAEGWAARDVDAGHRHRARRAAGGRAAAGRWLARLADEAYGLPRHLSQHSGGMIVATRPLIDCCPVLPAAMEGRQLGQWDKDSCADAGFLKIDLLGLGMLSAVERCVEEIARARGERIDLSRIPYDDPATYDAIQNADTMGVFQIESRAQMASLLRTRPENLDDLTIQVAIVRPGPILGGAVNPYIARLPAAARGPGLRGPLRPPVAASPCCEDTLGHDHLPGPGDRGRDGLRRLLAGRGRGAAAGDEPQALGGGDRGLPPALRRRARPPPTASTRSSPSASTTMIVGFSGFGFPKAHGAAFGLLAYQSTWLRVHYGPEFLCALLNEQPMGFYAPDTLVHEAQRRGIDAAAAGRQRAARSSCTVEAVDAATGAVRIGLGYVRGVRRRRGRGARRRARGGRAVPLARRPRLARRRRAAGAGAARLGGRVRRAGRRRRARAPRARCGSSASPRRASGCAGGHAARAAARAAGRAGAARRSTPWEAMIADYATTGLTLGPHPLALLRADAAAPARSRARDLERLRARARRCGSAGWSSRASGRAPPRAIVFLLLEDEFGTINLIVPPPVYERDRLIVRTEPLLLCEGRLERLPQAGGAINVLVERIPAAGAPRTPARCASCAEPSRAELSAWRRRSELASGRSRCSAADAVAHVAKTGPRPPRRLRAGRPPLQRVRVQPQPCAGGGRVDPVGHDLRRRSRAGSRCGPARRERGPSLRAPGRPARDRERVLVPVSRGPRHVGVAG